MGKHREEHYIYLWLNIAAEGTGCLGLFGACSLERLFEATLESVLAFLQHIIFKTGLRNMISDIIICY